MADTNTDICNADQKLSAHYSQELKVSLSHVGQIKKDKFFTRQVPSATNYDDIEHKEFIKYKKENVELNEKPWSRISRTAPVLMPSTPIWFLSSSKQINLKFVVTTFLHEEIVARKI